jgi:hypothetical protein
MQLRKSKMPTQTIRRNSLKAIRQILSECALVTCYKYDDMDTNTDKGSVSVDEVIEAGQSNGFDRVYKEVDSAGELVKIVAGIHRNHFYTGYATKDDAKRSLTDTAFARYFPAEAEADRKAQQAADDEQRAAYCAELDEAAATLITTQPQGVYFLGQRIVATFAALNKNNLMAQYVMECAKPENGEPFWNRTKWQEMKNWRVETCQVDRIATISAADYDIFVDNLMDQLPASLAGFEGGTATDYVLDREVAEFHQLTEDEREMWIAHSYRKVALVSAPGRQTIVIDPQGYAYVRYAGLYPKPLHFPAS